LSFDKLDPVSQLKFVNQVFDGSNDLGRPSGESGIPLWKLYVGGCIACHFHLGIYVRGELAAYNLCADFQRFLFSEDLIVDVEDASTLQLTPLNRDESRRNVEWIKHSMFVPIRALLEDRKGRQLAAAPTLVGLRFVNDCLVPRRKLLEGIQVGESLGIKLNRLFDPGFLSGLFGSSAVVDDELPVELIEGAAAIVRDVAQNHRHVQHSIARNYLDPKYMVTRIGVELGAHLKRIPFPSRTGRTSALRAL
jgi:hypothetical protein